MLRSAAGIALLFIAFLLGATEQESTGPLALCKRDVSAILVVLRNSELDRDSKWAQISVILHERIDFRTMSQRILASNWQNATPEDKDRFVDYFSQYLEQVYREKIEAYSNQRVEYIHETVRDDRAFVDTVIVTEATQIPVTYKMLEKDGDWYIYDVVIEGLSLVSNYQRTYGEKIKSDGMDALLADIKDQIEQYRAEYLLQHESVKPEI